MMYFLGFLAILFLVVVLVWIRAAPERVISLFFRGRACGSIIDLEERQMWVPVRNYTLKYFYPIIKYEFSVNGNKYYKTINGRNLYKKAEIGPWGDRRGEEEFFWRNLGEGDVVGVRYCKPFPRFSIIYPKV